MKIFSVIVLCLGLNAQAAIPSIEGLFRNSSNPEISGNIVTVKLIVEQQETKEKENLPEQSQNINLGDTAIEPAFIKLLFFRGDQDQLSMLQAHYQTSAMKKLERLVVERDFKNRMLNEGSIEKVAFYSILNMFVLNRSDEILSISEKLEGGLVRNKELIEKDKLDLYRNYLGYLAAIDAGKDKETLVSPLVSEDPEVQSLIKDTMKKRFYRIDERVKLERINESFYWTFKDEVFHAIFEKESLRLSSLSLNLPSFKKFELRTSQFILFDGIHELPRHLVMKLGDELYTVRFVEYKDLNLSRSFDQLLERYQKDLENTNKEEAQIQLSNLMEFLL